MTQGADHWIAVLKDARAALLDMAIGATNLAAFVLAQQERIEALEREVGDARAQCETWRQLAAERMEQLKHGEKRQ